MYFNNIYLQILTRNTLAIVLPWGVIFRQKEKDVLLTLLRHEVKHVMQIKEKGMWMFYISYLWEYFKKYVHYKKHFHAYMMNPYEMEARKEEDKDWDPYKYIKNGRVVV